MDMNREEQDARVLESLERTTTFFVCTLLAWQNLEEDDRPSRVRLLPDPSPACSLLCSFRVIYLATAAHSCIQQSRLLTKRDIYYMCQHLFKNSATVDRALAILSSIVGVHRNDLNIVAAPKGIVVGNVSFIDEDYNEINVGMFGSDGCLIPSRPERMVRVSVSATAIIVIEKEASFHGLLHESASKEFFSSCILVTGKGYPDHATRHFLNRLILDSQTQGKQIPTYLLTDADPHGICIAMCYLSSLTVNNVKWLGVKPSDNGKFFQISPRSLLPLQKSETVLLQSLSKRCSDDTGKSSKEHDQFQKELSYIKHTAMKFEMEALSVVRSSSNLSGLLEYVISKICDDKESEYSMEEASP